MRRTAVESKASRTRKIKKACTRCLQRVSTRQAAVDFDRMTCFSLSSFAGPMDATAAPVQIAFEKKRVLTGPRHKTSAKACLISFYFINLIFSIPFFLVHNSSHIQIYGCLYQIYRAPSGRAAYLLQNTTAITQLTRL